jgi:hypothetical protein
MSHLGYRADLSRAIFWAKAWSLCSCECSFPSASKRRAIGRHRYHAFERLNHFAGNL